MGVGSHTQRVGPSRGWLGTPSTRPTLGKGLGTDLAAAGEMGLEARHTGVDGFTALGTGGNHGRGPPSRCPRTNIHALLAQRIGGFSGVSVGLDPRNPGVRADWTSPFKDPAGAQGSQIGWSLGGPLPRATPGLFVLESLCPHTHPTSLPQLTSLGQLTWPFSLTSFFHASSSWGLSVGRPGRV